MNDGWRAIRLRPVGKPLTPVSSAPYGGTGDSALETLS